MRRSDGYGCSHHTPHRICAESRATSISHLLLLFCHLYCHAAAPTAGMAGNGNDVGDALDDAAHKRKLNVRAAPLLDPRTPAYSAIANPICLRPF